MKVFVAHMSAECNEHVARDAKLEDFLLLYGQECIDEMCIRDIFEERGIEIVPSIFAGINPSGMIEHNAYEFIAGRIIDDLRAHLDEIDAIYLQLHGASGVRGLDCVSGEHELLRRIRAIVGVHMPIALALDPHGNVTAELASRVNILRCFRESPHIDTVDTWRIVAEKLVDLMRHRRPMHPVMRKLPIIVEGERSVSANEPMRSINRLLDEAEADERVFSCSYHVGYLRHDDDKLGAAVVVVPNTPADAAYCEQVAERISRYAWEHRDEFTFGGNYGDAADAVARAVAFEGKTAVITDSGDNCGAGSSGCGTVVLRELLAQDLRGKRVLVAGVNDVDACRELFAANVGDHVEFSLGVGADEVSAPVELAGTLSCVGDAAVGSQKIVGSCYIVTVDGTGIDVLVMPHNVQYGHMEQFHAAGVEFHDYDIVVVKMGYLDTYLIPETAYHIMALTPGPTDQIYEKLPFRRIFRPMWPIDELNELIYIE